MMSGTEGKSQDEIQQHMLKVGEVFEKKMSARCGPDPRKYNQDWASAQAREALGRASDMFSDDHDHGYYGWKEWAGEFCRYIEKLKKEDPDHERKIAKMREEGLRFFFPGAGNLIYSASEVKVLLENCDTLLPLIAATM